MTKRKAQSGNGGFAKRQQEQSAEQKKEAQKKAMWQLGLGTLALFGITAVLLFVLPQLFGGNETTTPTPAPVSDTSNEESSTSSESSASSGTIIEGDRPLAALAANDRANYYADSPPTVLDPNKQYEAIIETANGNMRFALFAEQAPLTVNNFVYLANQGFYDNTTFHRVIEGFMAQAGDPTGTGMGGPGYQFADEIDPELTFDRPVCWRWRMLAPARTGANFSSLTRLRRG
jgi:hypothetical protein